MLDATNALATPKTEPRIIRLADYTPPAFLVETVDLVFLLDEQQSHVEARLSFRRNPENASEKDLRLDGDALVLERLSLDGEELGTNRYTQEAKSLVITDVPDRFTLDIRTRIEPQNNLELSGLYKSGGNFCTQCEAEGFRRITFFPDRPDVMARYTTTIVADQQRYPVLLSNGNPVDRGQNPDGKHWVKWEDPHPKPCYLFALVAGNLISVKDSFTTKSGRKVDLGIWVRPGDEDKCAHAMQSLKDSMAWDEKAFGLEYDLDIFNIVAVSDFNMGAMENKGLNVFNTKYVLAKPDTATDTDYQGIESVIGHEYFHNWTGNRITCRDWFQLSLKEGLTVYRDQAFSAAQGSEAVKRIIEVRRLRASQFPEDDGPLAHPVRPETYIEINNFYTPTVYQKGSEVVRMIGTLLGTDHFRKGMDLYVARHDNHAVTIEDFVAAMQDASGQDLSQFKRWYSQAGTPELEVEDSYDPAAQRYSLTIKQSLRSTPGQTEKLPMLIPVAMGLLGPAGNEISSRLEGEAAAISSTRVLRLTEAVNAFTFVDVAERPVPSLLRGFSAPVKLKGMPMERLLFLAKHDSDSFVRWESGQQVATALLLDMVAAYRRGDALTVEPELVETIQAALDRADVDPALAAEAIMLPGEAFLADQMQQVDVEAIHAARHVARIEIAAKLHDQFLALYQQLGDDGPYQIDGLSIGRRSLRNACLGYLAAAQTAEGIRLAKQQFDGARNMTDSLAALMVLSDIGCAERVAALESFYERWQADDLVIDKWFSLQAISALPRTIDTVHALLKHPAFDVSNPNRVRSLVGSFGMGNQLHFHEASGAGYEFLADQVVTLDGFNAQMAARMVTPLGTWRRHDNARQQAMKQALERILRQPTLSKGTFEMASRSLL